MRVLEIIHLRSAGERLVALSEKIEESLRTTDEQAEVVTMYSRSGLGTDLAVHIHREVADETGRSILGHRLAVSLRVYGLVEHTVWEELR
jgi:predicted DNA-binding protein with PD1-like motif